MGSRQEETLKNPNNYELILHDSPNIIAQRLSAYNSSIDEIRTFYTNEHQNWYPFNAKQNRWKLWKLVQKRVINNLDSLQNYVRQTKLSKAASVHHLCITPLELKTGISKKFQHLCPVSLFEKQEIRDSVVKTSLDFTAKYKSAFYRMDSQEKLEKFLENPE